MNAPRCTVVIRSFNRLPELRALLDVVLAQRDADFEVLIVDSTKGMTDAEFTESLACADARVRVLRTPPRGCAAVPGTVTAVSCSLGTRAARSRFVAFSLVDARSRARSAGVNAGALSS